MEHTWRRAHDWANETGQGVKENEGIESFEAKVKQYCSFYFILYDVMVDRSSSRPSVLTDNL